MMQTDANALIISWYTLHALLHAAYGGKRAAFCRAGYEAGVLYGVGEMKWFTGRTEIRRNGCGLFKDLADLLRAFSKIDHASAWVNRASETPETRR